MTKRVITIVALGLVILVGIAVLVSRSQTPPVTATAPAPTATSTPVLTSSPQATPTSAPTGAATLPTTIRWGIDKGSPDDPQHRSLLVLFYNGSASSFRVLDASGNLVLRVPIAGSGIFGPETCVVRARLPNEITTFTALDRATVDLFVQRYRSYRVVAEGIPAGQATLDLVDSGCRPPA